MDNVHLIESSLRHQFLTMFRTDNAFIDGILTVMIISLLSYIVKQFSDLPTVIGNFYNKIMIKIRLFFRPKSADKISKTTIIESLSEDKKPNELYTAVYWFLTTNIDLTVDSNVKMSFTKKIELDEYKELKDKNINKNMSYGTKKIFNYAHNNITFEIEYFFATNLVSVYTDKKRDKENHIIYLTTLIDPNIRFDVFEEFSKMCMREYAKSLVDKKWVQKIFTNSNGRWTETVSNNRRKIETVILRKGLNKLIMDDLNLFLESEIWYNERDIPYKRGYLFKGPPGTGKTSMIKAISTHTKRHIHYLILNNIQDDNELINLLNAVNCKETILVLEDIDCASEAVKSREKEEETVVEKVTNDKSSLENKILSDQLKKAEKVSKLTLSGILNSLDGIFNSEGRIVIMTTNHSEVLDPALIRRGRIDMQIEFSNCDRYQIAKMYENFYGKNADSDILSKIPSDIYSPAHVSGLLLSYRNNPENSLIELTQ